MTNAYDEIQQEFNKKLEKLEHKFKAEKDKLNNSNLPDPIPKSKKGLRPITNAPKELIKEKPKEITNFEPELKKDKAKEVASNTKNNMIYEIPSAQAIIKLHNQTKNNSNKFDNRFEQFANEPLDDTKNIKKNQYDIKPFKPVDDCNTLSFILISQLPINSY